MKITVYTITDCKFSQAEKQYLQSKQVQFEEKNLEANREFLTEMLNISNNFAGTPVTKIEKDDGQIIVLKGFTQDEFDKALTVDPNAVVKPVVPEEKPLEAPVAQPVAAPAPPQDPFSAPAPQSAPPQNPMTQPPMPIAAPEPVQPAPAPVAYQPPPAVDTTTVQPPAVNPADDQAMNSVLQNLQSRSGDNA